MYLKNSPLETLQEILIIDLTETGGQGTNILLNFYFFPFIWKFDHSSFNILFNIKGGLCIKKKKRQSGIFKTFQ